MFSGVDYIQPNERGIIVFNHILFPTEHIDFCASFTPFLFESWNHLAPPSCLLCTVL
jgi:hypothetical protein